MVIYNEANHVIVCECDWNEQFTGAELIEFIKKYKLEDTKVVVDDCGSLSFYTAPRENGCFYGDALKADIVYHPRYEDDPYSYFEEED